MSWPEQLAKGMTYVDVLMTNATKNARAPVRDRVKTVYVNFLVITGYVIPIVIILYSYGQILYQLLMNKSIRDIAVYDILFSLRIMTT